MSGISVRSLKYEDIDTIGERLSADRKYFPYYYLPLKRQKALEDFLTFKLRTWLTGSDFEVKVVSKDGLVEGLLVIAYNRFDSHLLKRKCFSFPFVKTFSGDARVRDAVSQALIDESVQFCKSHKVEFLSLRINSEEYVLLNTFLKKGFFVVADELSFLCETSRVVACKKRDDWDIELHDHYRSTTVFNDLAQQFRASRLYNDPFFSVETADFLWKKWIQRQCEEEAEKIAVIFDSRNDKMMAGMITCARGNGSEYLTAKGVWHLFFVCILKEFRGQGMGEYLLKNLVNIGKAYCDYIEVGTQTTNYRAINLYTKCGFRAVNANTSLHAWLQ